MASLPMPPMGGQAPQQGPPPAFGSPTLSNIPQGAPPPQAGGQAAGALPRMVFQLDQQIQTLARALPPDTAAKLDAIREQLREIVAEAVSGGTGGQTPPTAGPY
jgi:hypothetical protein